jgi:hypothetical protein
MQRIAAVRSAGPGPRRLYIRPYEVTLTTSELIDSTLHVVDHGARLRQRQAVRVDLLGIPWLLE